MQFARQILFVVLALSVSAVQQAQAAAEADKAAVTTMIDRYCNAWSEPDAARRQQLLDQVWAEDGTYTDPLSNVAGRSNLSALIGGFLQQYPGSRIVLASAVDLHHERVRFAWKWVLADGSTTMEGMDFGELASDGRLRKIVGFFGPVVPLP